MDPHRGIMVDLADLGLKLVGPRNAISIMLGRLRRGQAVGAMQEFASTLEHRGEMLSRQKHPGIYRSLMNLGRKWSELAMEESAHRGEDRTRHESTHLDELRRLVGATENRSALIEGKNIGPEAQRAFDDEIAGKYLRNKVDRFISEMDQEMLGIEDGKWPKSSMEYTVMRHRPMKMMHDDFIQQVIQAYLGWRDKFR